MDYPGADTTIPMKVDLVDLQSAPDDLKYDILREGIRWTEKKYQIGAQKKGIPMIGWVHGTVKAIHEQSITLIAGPMGFEVFIANPHAYKQNQTIDLYMHLHWNQEQGPTLYGFATKEEKLVFLSIISCSGIGPKLALAILGHCGASSFVQAIAEEEIKTLSAIPGIGKKKAEQLIVNLKHKVAKLLEKGIVLGSSNLSELQQISEVLSSLNYSRSEITATLDYLKKTDNTTITFDLMLRNALSFLSKRV